MHHDFNWPNSSVTPIVPSQLPQFMSASLSRPGRSCPSTVTEAAALFERVAQPLYDGDDFTVIEHAIELWKGGEANFSPRRSGLHG
jgi:hypothetical protein